MDPVLAQIYELVMPAAPYVIAAYGVLWLGIFAYLFLIDRRLGKLEQQLDVIEQAASRKASV
jgi:CcmD family protein